jgi:hypothetical protein
VLYSFRKFRGDTTHVAEQTHDRFWRQDLLRSELDRLVMALASGTDSPTITTAIGGREKRLTEVRARLEVIAVAPSVLDLEVRRLEKEARARLADFQALLTRNVAQGRKALEALFDGPLRFTETQTDDGRRFLIEGTAAVGSMFSIESVPKGIRTWSNPDFVRDFCHILKRSEGRIVADLGANSANLAARSIDRSIAPPPSEALDAALADALQRASAAGEWGAVTALAAELSARRLSPPAAI